MQSCVNSTGNSIITGYLTDEFVTSSGQPLKTQLGDRLFGLKSTSDAALISFYVDNSNKIGKVEKISLTQLKATVMKLASILRAQLLPLVQQRELDRSSEKAQSQTYLATHVSAGINRVYIQLACMQLRLAYIPMDGNLSEQRINGIIDTYCPIAFVSDNGYIKSVGTKTPTFELAKLLAEAESSGHMKEDLLFRGISNPVILLLFTSGSTSPFPKGILLRNTQMYNRLSWQWGPESPLAEIKGPGLAKTSWLFVDAFTEMFGPLLCGRTIVVSGNPKVSGERIVSDVELLGSLVKQFKIAQITSVPSQLESWLKLLVDGSDDFQFVQAIVSSGQMLPYSLALKVYEVFKQRPLRLLNFYGSTEVAGDVTAMVFDSEEDIRASAVRLSTGGFILPVGKPVDNVEIYVIGGDSETGRLKTVKKGIEGAIFVSGAAVLVDEPISVSQDDSKPTSVLAINEFAVKRKDCFPRLFPTGDVGFICPDRGYLYISGREDDTVKVNGVKVCVSNIDQLLASLRRQDKEGGRFGSLGTTLTLPLTKSECDSVRLVCFYTREHEANTTGNTFTDSDLAEAVKQHFSAFLNVAFVELDSFPIQTQSGKVDKVKVMQNFKQGLYKKANRSTVKVPTESTVLDPRRETIRKIFAEHLGLSETGDLSDNEDFFLIGGDSISAAMIVAELRKEGMKITMNDISKKSRIGDLLDMLVTHEQPSIEEPKGGPTMKPFVRQFQPGKTFASQPDLDNRFREVIAEVIAISFVELEPVAKLIGMRKEEIHQIVMGRMLQFETIPGLVFVAGYTNKDPMNALEDLYPDVSAAILGFPMTTPISPGVDSKLYPILEESFEACNEFAESLADINTCFCVGMAGGIRRKTADGDLINLLTLMEEALIDGAGKLGFTKLRSINTSIVTQVMSAELGYKEDCIVNIVDLLESRGIKCNQRNLPCQVATLTITRDA